MANVIVKDIDVAAEKLLSWIKGAARAIVITPTVVAALGVLLGAVGKAIADGQTAITDKGLNIAIDEQTWTDIRAVWPDIVTLAKDVGIKL